MTTIDTCHNCGQKADEVGKDISEFSVETFYRCSFCNEEFSIDEPRNIGVETVETTDLKIDATPKPEDAQTLIRDAITRTIDNLFPVKPYQLARDVDATAGPDELLYALRFAVRQERMDKKRQLDEAYSTINRLNLEFMIMAETIARLAEGITDDHLNHSQKNERLRHLVCAMQSAKKRINDSAVDNSDYISWLKSQSFTSRF